MNRLDEIMKKKNISTYALSKKSGIPISTIRDLKTGKTKIENASVRTALTLCKAMRVDINELIKNNDDFNYEIFKSNVCHQVRDMGDINWLKMIDEEDIVFTKYYKENKPAEALYLLGMYDYLCRKNKIKLSENYCVLRQRKLKNPLYPKWLFFLFKKSQEDEGLRKIAEKELKKAIPEFLRFNIIEADVEDIV